MVSSSPSPPPPPRATLPPPRPAPIAKSPLSGARPDAGMGTAGGGVRWKGEVQAVGDKSEAEEPQRRFDITRAMPSWLFSLVVHLILLVLLTLLTTPAGQNLGRVLLTIGQADGKSEGELAEFSIDEVLLPSEAEWNDSELQSDVPMSTIDDLSFELSAEAIAEAIVPLEFGAGETGIAGAPMVGGRSGAMKQTLLAMFGGTPVTEGAVSLGLKWLAKNQTKDGSWSLVGPYDDGGNSENRPAATAMALLAMVGAGNTHLTGEYREVVDRGLRWLVKRQDRDGYFARDVRDHQQAYAQAQCSIVVCELYAMTKDSWLRSYAQAAIDCAENWQGEEGGWRYFPGSGGDMSVTGWYVMALQSGVAGGLEVDRTVLYRVPEFLDSVQSYDGAGYSYQPRGAASQAMTAEGLLCRQYLGWPRNHPPLVAGVTSLANNYKFNIRDPDFYYWYYATQVLHHYGGKPWTIWNAKMKVDLPAAQSRTGRDAGSWSPQNDDWRAAGGRLYSTCMAIYCLEVYYRHLPLYRTEFDGEAIPGVAE